MPQERNRFEYPTTRRSLDTEYEFIGQTRDPSSHSLMSRIDELRLELADAERSTRTLLDLNRLAISEMPEVTD